MIRTGAIGFDDEDMLVWLLEVKEVKSSLCSRFGFSTNRAQWRSQSPGRCGWLTPEAIRNCLLCRELGRTLLPRADDTCLDYMYCRC